VTNYFSHAGFLEDDVLLRNASRLTGIPAVLIHGRLDISGPPDMAWQLNRSWPDSELILLDDVGHGATLDAVLAATQRFARRGNPLTTASPGGHRAGPPRRRRSLESHSEE